MQRADAVKIYLADPGKASRCSTNTIVIIQVSQGDLPYQHCTAYIFRASTKRQESTYVGHGYEVLNKKKLKKKLWFVQN